MKFIFIDGIASKRKKDCRWDLVALGEVMLRFDPGDDHIHNARSFRVWEGGGEYNIARSLAKVFQLDALIVTALADNQIGRLVAWRDFYDKYFFEIYF